MSYLPNQELRYSNKNPIGVQCDCCNNTFDILYKSAEKNKKKYGCHKCCTCTGIRPKPQNKQEYWTPEKRQDISARIKSSDIYQKAIRERDTSGNKNGMFGKKASNETKLRMSLSRTGKVGSKATAWKGGKTSINKRVKEIIHKRYQWYFKVYQRDGWKCVECGSKKKIDAHHIEAMNQIIKRLCENRYFANDDDKVAWLIEQPEIIDIELKNGITLCRQCHRTKHGKKWGSHDCK
jgi:hypothetical protein